MVGTKANDESFQGDIKPEAGLAVTYANEKQALQHEFDTKEEIPEVRTKQTKLNNNKQIKPFILRLEHVNPPNIIYILE